MDIYNRLMRIPIPTMYEVDKDGERYVQRTLHGLTFQSVFDLIKAQHWHSAVKDGVVHTCPHSESLHDHLVSCATICQAHVHAFQLMQNHSDSTERVAFQTKPVDPLFDPLFHVKMYLAGLLHDVGKPGTLRFTNKHLAFKGHSITGGALIRSWWSKAIQTEFGLSEHDWSDIATCADVHMCGYGFDSTEQQMDTFSLLSNQVREMLVYLRLGDSLSKVPSNNKVMGNHAAFTARMEKQTTLVDFCTKYELNNGILIQVQGSSASGKTRMARKICKYLEAIGVPSNVIHNINRDQATVHCSRKAQGINQSTDQSTGSFMTEQFTPEEYRQCLKHYRDSSKSYAHAINQIMKSAILEYLEAGEIVITDTLATKYYFSSREIIPTCASNSFKMSVWCCRPIEISEEESLNRLGMSLDEQLRISGVRGLMSPLGEHEHWEDAMSIGESGGHADNQCRPHISLSTSWATTNVDLLNILDQFPFVYSYQMTIPRTLNLANTRSMSMCQLLSALYHRGTQRVPLNRSDSEKTAERGADQIVQFFSKYFYRVSKPMKGTELENHVFVIKYMEHNREFHPWSRNEARGQCYYVDFDAVFPLKYSLQRGIEVLAKFHSDDSIRETENIGGITGVDVSNLEPAQIHVVNALSKENSELNAVLTAKADGSLILVTVYPVGTREYEIIDRCIRYIGESKILHVRTGNALIVIATQGTLFISPDMHDYFLTSVFSVFKGAFKTWSEIKDLFGEWILKQLAVANISTMCTLAYEAICKDRRADGVVHTELAISYDRSQFVFLGLFHAIDENIRFVPHFELEGTMSLCEHPPIVRVTNSSEVFAVMKDLSNAVIGTLSIADFSNKYFSDPNAQFNPEGFVLLTRYNGVWDYSKIKSTMYYKLHKIRNEDIPSLLAYSDECANNIGRYFPLLRSLRVSRNSSRSEAIEFVSSVFGWLKQDVATNSSLFTDFSVKARARADQFISNYGSMDETSIDMSNATTVKNIDSFWKMTINTCDLHSAYAKYVSAFSCCEKMSVSDIETIGKGLLMAAKPWFPNWKDRINNASINGEPMATLIAIYVR